MDDNTVPTTTADDLEAALAERESVIVRQNETTQALLDRLRQAYLEAEPALDAALLSGQTLEELEASHAAAIALVARVRGSAPAPLSVPAGAPSRVVAAPSTAFEKIRSGLAGLAR